MVPDTINYANLLWTKNVCRNEDWHEETIYHLSHDDFDWWTNRLCHDIKTSGSRWLLYIPGWDYCTNYSQWLAVFDGLAMQHDVTRLKLIDVKKFDSDAVRIWYRYKREKRIDFKKAANHLNILLMICHLDF